MDEAARRAQGLALTVLEALLISRGVIESGDLSAGPEDIAEATAKTDAAAADVLEDWAAMLAQVGAPARPNRQ